MRWMLWIAVLGSIATGCKKGPVDTGPVGPQGVQHPDLACQEGTIGLGSPPPEGLEIYCARVLLDGTDIRQGPALTWHSATRKASTGSYLENKLSGAWQFWHPNGALFKQGNYVGGKKEGRWVAFHPNGERSSEGEFVGDREQGAWLYWSEDGLTRTEGRYDYGNREGKWVDHGPDDRPVRERTYRRGRLINQREYTN